MVYIIYSKLGSLIGVIRLQGLSLCNIRYLGTQEMNSDIIFDTGERYTAPILPAGIVEGITFSVLV